ncbi:MAG: hypothetical protein PHX62_06830 [Bacilli bacterium]|nr:hypothetical protein [Bacilli bacterium]
MFYDYPNLFENEINPILSYYEDMTTRKSLERRMLSRVPFIIYDPSGEDLITPQTISLVRAHNSIARTVANLFGLNQTYYFGVNALSDTKTLVYNPRNFDIFVDGLTISGQSIEYVIDDGYENIYDYEKMGVIVDAFRSEKDFNDKLLKTEIFPKLFKEDD